MQSGPPNPLICEDMKMLHTTSYTSSLEKKCRLYSFNPMGGQIRVKFIETLYWATPDISMHAQKYRI